MPPPYIIKRYANRKLYDPQASRYVSLDDLRQLIRSGAELRVEDASTGEDLTALTLTQVLLEGERTGHAALPTPLLHQMIKHGEAWYSLLQESLQASLRVLPAAPRDAEQVWRSWAALTGWPLEPPETPAAAGPPAGKASLEDEVAALKAHLQALEAKWPPPRKPRGAPRARRRRPKPAR